MTKQQWHKKYKDQILNYFGNKCINCNRRSHLQVHHNTYQHKKGVYNIDAQTAIKEKIVTVLCEPCHLSIHKEISIDGLTKILHKSTRRVVCIDCGANFLTNHEDNSYCDHNFISDYDYDEKPELWLYDKNTDSHFIDESCNKLSWHDFETIEEYLKFFPEERKQIFNEHE